jgi:hypothetical protein
MLASVAAVASAAGPWANNYACGDGPVFNPSWDPAGGGPSSPYLMTNLGNNLYGVTITPGGLTDKNMNLFEWKVTDGSWSNTAPADNAFGRAETLDPIQLRCDFNPANDGWIPDVGVDAQNGVLYTIPKVWHDLVAVGLPGDFNSWNTTATLCHDDGVAPDQTAGDGIFTASITASPGTYGFLAVPVYDVTVGGVYDFKLSKSGIAKGDNLSMVVTSNDPVTVYVDSNKGRIKWESAAPPITYPCAVSSAWSTVPGTETELFDDGTHGDAVAGDNIYSRVFTVTNPATGGIDTVQVIDGSNSYPATAGYPFKSTNGATVVVSYDKNSYSDGCQPSTKIVWVDPSHRILPGDPVGPTGVFVTGDFPSLFGGTDWTPGDPLMQLVDNGTNGDAVAGDQIYTITFPAGIVPTISGKNWKAVGQTWDWQYGSPDNGFTYHGNNPNQPLNATAGQDLVFKVDAVNGRAGYGQPTLANPTRPAAAVFNNSPSGIADWQLF